MFDELFIPVEHNPEHFEEYHLGSVIQTNSGTMPDWAQAHLCLIGIDHGGNYSGHEIIRNELYKLVCQNQHLKIVDLGNIRSGRTESDTEFALTEIVRTLKQEGVIPMVLGKNAAHSYAQYRGFEGIARNIEYCAVVSKFELRNNSYFTRICTHEPNILFNFTTIGFQSHLVDDDSVSAFKKMFFHPVRVGLLRNRLNEIEPVLRNTDLATIDLSCVKAGDNPASEDANPNGLSSEEICQIAWYAGISEKMRSFGLYSYQPELDLRNRSAKLSAQVLWYFMDGFYNRKGDHPSLHNEFLKYRCALESNQPDILFYKSKRTDRWWMEIPNPRSLGNAENTVMIPCTYADYQTATAGEMPERFWQALQKL